MPTLPPPPQNSFVFLDVDSQKRLRLESRELHTFLLLLWKLVTGSDTGNVSISGGQEDNLVLQETIDISLKESIRETEEAQLGANAVLRDYNERITELEVLLANRNSVIHDRITELEMALANISVRSIQTTDLEAELFDKGVGETEPESEAELLDISVSNRMDDLEDYLMLI